MGGVRALGAGQDWWELAGSSGNWWEPFGAGCGHTVTFFRLSNPSL